MNSKSKIKDYQLLSLIGRGSYNGISVSLGRHAPSDSTVAIKRFNLEICEITLNIISHEIQMHSILHHPNILPIIDSFVTGPEIWSIHPAMAYGSCKDLIMAHFHEGFIEIACCHILKSVLSALQYLHQRYTIHRSLKSSHVLIGSDGHICLSGLRHCCSMIENGIRRKNLHDFPKFYTASLNSASREILEQNLAGYDTKSDIYSFGILACELANGCTPFQDMPLTHMLLSKLKGVEPQLLDNNTVKEINLNSACVQSNQRTYSKHFHEIVQLCFTFDPTARPTSNQLSGHPFFKQLKSKFSLCEHLKPVQTFINHKLSLDDLAMNELTSTVEDLTLQNFEWNS